MSNIICGVPDCKLKKSTDDSVEFFPLPKMKTTRMKWLGLCGLNSSVSESTIAFICSRHFEENSYITEIKEFGSLTCLIRVLDPDAVPTLNIPSLSDEHSESTLDHRKIQKDAAKLKMANQMLEKQINNLNVPKIDELTDEDNQNYSHIKTQEDLLKLKVVNQILMKKIKISEFNISSNKNYIKKKEHLLAELQNQATEKKIFSKEVLSKVFSKRQIKLLCGTKKTHWSEDELSVGLTVRYLSNRRFYDYLTNSLSFPLPGISSIKRYIIGRKRASGNYSKSHTEKKAN